MKSRRLCALVAAEAGPPEIVEFQWPPATEDQNSSQCLAFVVMKGPAGFLLCVPVGFIGQEELDQGQLPMEAEMIGPSLEIEAPAIMLGPAGEWTSPLVPERLPALVVDLPMSMAAQLLPAEMDTPGLHTFKDGDAAAFPLAAEVLRLSREWLRGYQTAQSGQENGPKAKAQQRPKRPTVQQLATQQAKMMEIMTAVVGRLDALAASQPPPGLDAEGPQLTKPVGAPAVLQQPLSSVLPPAQVVAKNLAKTLGPPPPARAQPFALQVQVDKRRRCRARSVASSCCLGESALGRGGRSSARWPAGPVGISAWLCRQSKASAGTQPPLRNFRGPHQRKHGAADGPDSFDATRGCQLHAFSGEARQLCTSAPPGVDCLAGRSELRLASGTRHLIAFDGDVGSSSPRRQRHHPSVASHAPVPSASRLVSGTAFGPGGFHADLHVPCGTALGISVPGLSEGVGHDLLTEVGGQIKHSCAASASTERPACPACPAP